MFYEFCVNFHEKLIKRDIYISYDDTRRGKRKLFSNNYMAVFSGTTGKREDGAIYVKSIYIYIYIYIYILNIYIYIYIYYIYIYIHIYIYIYIYAP